MNLMTLEQAGIPQPDNLNELRRLFAQMDKAVVKPHPCYGGYLRDMLCLGTNKESGDIDLVMSLDDFLGLKDPEHDVRRHFLLHEPHLLYLMHVVRDNRLDEIDELFVLRLKDAVRVEWGLEHDVGITVTRSDPTPDTLLHDSDLGFCDVVFDGETIWVSEDFVTDWKNRTMTMTRCRDAKDYERTLRRVQRFKEGRYREWAFMVPERFAHHLVP